MGGMTCHFRISTSDHTLLEILISMRSASWDYYKTVPEGIKMYKTGCGRDHTLEKNLGVVRLIRAEFPFALFAAQFTQSGNLRRVGFIMGRFYVERLARPIFLVYSTAVAVACHFALTARIRSGV